MGANGGSPQEANVAGRVFNIDGESDDDRDLGGKKAEVKVDGNGNARILASRKPWSIKLNLVIDSIRGDQEFLQDLIDNAEPFSFSYIDASDQAWGNGGAMITGDLVRKGKDGVMEVTFEGGGKLSKQ